jgi:putative transposase
MKVNKGIVFRIKPNSTQLDKLAKHFGHNRFIWNYFLQKRREDYQRNKEGSNYYKDAAALTELKKKSEYSWLYECSTASQQRTLKHLDDAYKRFFKGKAKFPNFKSKRGKQSFTMCGDISIKNKRVYFPLFSEGIRFNRELPEYSKINNLTVTKTPSGLYYVSLSVEAKTTSLPKTKKKVGIDLGLIDFAVLSNGKRIKNPRHLRLHEKALARAQKHLSRKQKGSKRKDKQRIKVARIYEKITNIRKAFLHRTSHYIVNNFDKIMVEDLAIKNMIKNRSLSKHIADVGWRDFINMLTYKTEWYGKKLVTIERFFPSSKTCSECGFINQSLSLDIREWKCTSCNTQHDRDLNASRNILAEGIKLSGRSPRLQA